MSFNWLSSYPLSLLVEYMYYCNSILISYGSLLSWIFLFLVSLFWFSCHNLYFVFYFSFLIFIFNFSFILLMSLSSLIYSCCSATNHTSSYRLSCLCHLDKSHYWQVGLLTGHAMGIIFWHFCTVWGYHWNYRLDNGPFVDKRGSKYHQAEPAPLSLWVHNTCHLLSVIAY